MRVKNTENYDVIAKILLLGEIAVGKSSMILRYVEGRFPGEYQATIGANFLVKNVTVSLKDGTKKNVMLQIWDLGGHVRTITHVGPIFYQNANGALLVYDLTRPETLEKLPLWYEACKAYAPRVKTLVVGNKCDLERKVPKNEGVRVARQLNAVGFYETSAKTGDNIEDVFNSLARSIITE